MSLLLSPLVLFLVGLLVARVSKSRRIWKRHGLFTRRSAAVILVLYGALELALLVDAGWVQPLVHWLPGDTGTEWVVGTFLGLDGSWPIEDKGVMVFVVASFAAFPLWLWWGVTLGYWLWGRSPKQTGIMGLLR